MNLYVLGPEGTNSHEAATRLSTSLESNEIVFCERNIDALRSASRENGYAVVPIENSSAGLVNDVVKAFWMVPGSDALHVVGETRLPIEHYLLVRPDVDEVASIRTVASHPQALAQCGAYLSEQRWIRIPSSSTALSARLVSEDPAMRDTAAIASRFAAERYGLRILREHIEDAEGNATRFHLVGPNGTHPTGHDRTPVVFRLPDEAGALLRVLQIIAGVGVNMSSLHSIPMGTTGEFAFYCELDCHRDDERGRPIVEGIRTFVPSLRVLGSYSI